MNWGTEGELTGIIGSTRIFYSNGMLECCIAANVQPRSSILLPIITAIRENIIKPTFQSKWGLFDWVVGSGFYPFSPLPPKFWNSLVNFSHIWQRGGALRETEVLQVSDKWRKRFRDLQQKVEVCIVCSAILPVSRWTCKRWCPMKRDFVKSLLTVEMGFFPSEEVSYW